MRSRRRSRIVSKPKIVPLWQKVHPFHEKGWVFVWLSSPTVALRTWAITAWDARKLLTRRNRSSVNADSIDLMTWGSR